MRTFLVFSGNVENLRYFSPCSIEAIKNKTDQLNQKYSVPLETLIFIFNEVRKGGIPAGFQTQDRRR